ncbi:hypothetical protein ACWCQN_04050 [Streptomyces sp. NPDC001984]
MRITRPLAAPTGEYLSRPPGDGGPGPGAVVTGARLLTAIPGLVIHLSVRRHDVTGPGRGARHAE